MLKFHANQSTVTKFIAWKLCLHKRWRQQRQTLNIIWSQIFLWLYKNGGYISWTNATTESSDLHQIFLCRKIGSKGSVYYAKYGILVSTGWNGTCFWFNSDSITINNTFYIWFYPALKHQSYMWIIRFVSYLPYTVDSWGLDL